MYRSTKTYGHECGLSVAFRQHLADSHCKFIHGYALGVRLEFAAEELDRRGWVIDFGGMKAVKEYLTANFDHKLLVARDDPYRASLLRLSDIGVADVVIVPSTGCEAFAAHIFSAVTTWLRNNGHSPRVWLVSVEVREHGANSAIYNGEQP